MDISNKIDYTLLKPEATFAQIELLCKNAIEKKYASVCIAPSYVKFAKSHLENTNIKLCTVIGFPLGSNTTKIKVKESVEAVLDGADEIDMVVNIGLIKGKEWNAVLKDIKSVVNKFKLGKKVIIKVIIETCLLTTEEKIKVCKIIQESGADFIKTSTGYSNGGATIEDVKLIKEIVGDTVKIKASGGIKDYETAIKMINAGADRIGTSALL